MSNPQEDQYIENAVEMVRARARYMLLQTQVSRSMPDKDTVLAFVQTDLWLKFNAEAKRKAAEEAAAAAPPKKDGPRTTELL